MSEETLPRPMDETGGFAFDGKNLRKPNGEVLSVSDAKKHLQNCKTKTCDCHG